MYNLVWIRSPLPTKGNVGPKPFQQNAFCSITEPLDPLTVGVKYPGLYYCLGVHHTCTTSLDNFTFSIPVPVFFAPLDLKMH